MDLHQASQSSTAHEQSEASTEANGSDNDIEMRDVARSVSDYRNRAPSFGLPRQTAFGAAGPHAMRHHIETQTQSENTIEEVRVDRPNRVHPYLQAHLPPRLVKVLGATDSAFFCYVFSSIILLAAGGGCIYLLIQTNKKSSNDDGDRYDKTRSAAQLWIVGPIFICSAILVGVKAVTHIHKRMHPMRFRFVDGHILEPDNRDSIAAIPPNYSQALDAPVPSEVYDMDAESKSATQPPPDSESLRRVTLNFDPKPPTYEEVASKKRFKKPQPKHSQQISNHSPSTDEQ